MLFKIFIFLVFLISALHSIELKTNYQDGYPKYFINEQGELDGICVDILKLIEKKAPQIKFSAPKDLVAFKRIKSDLQHGKIDIFLGMTRTKDRESKFVYLDPPLYEVNHVIAVRADDKVDIKNFEDIRKLGANGVILTNQGTSTQRYLKKQTGLHIDSEALNLSSNLKKLLFNRGRFLYFHDLGMVSTIKKEGLTKKVRIVPSTFKKYSHYLVFSKTTPKHIVEKVESILNEISQNGELKKIVDKYFQVN